VYRFLKEAGSGFIQFIPLVERSAHAPLQAENGLIQLALAAPAHSAEERSPVTDWSVRSEDYGTFLTTIFDEWVRQDVGRVFVQHFDVALGNWAGAGGSLCVFSPTCGKALAVEHNGDVYSCDHYVYPEWRLGNLRDRPLAEMVASAEQVKFGQDKSDTLPRYCRECDVRFACHGECPSTVSFAPRRPGVGPQLPVRRLQAFLHAHRRVHADDGAASARWTRADGDHGADRESGTGGTLENGGPQ